MTDESRNIYKTARRAAGYTQEEAAERLALSVRAISDYETGQRVPPNQTVEDMVVLYDAQYLAYQHLHQTNALMGHVLPDLEQRSVMEAAVRIYNRMSAFTAKHSPERLLEIAEDGVIDADERADFDRIVAEMMEIIKSGMELRVFCGEEDHHDADRC